jgi:hypothetical protein
MTLPIAQKLRRIATAVSLLLLAFTLIPNVLAQETTAAIQGTVTDPTGAVVPNASVVATSDSLISKAAAKTDSHGFYRLNALPPGTYTVTVTGSGMTYKATDLKLSAGDLPNLNISLTVSGTEAIIDVSSAVAMVDVTQSKVETTISQEILNEIPKGRSFQSVIPFAPGARQEPLQSMATLNGSSTPNAGGNSNTGGNSSRNNGYQIDGASDAENTYLMDGVNITNIQGGGVGQNVPFPFVQEVQVKSSSFEAEFGGALGGVINVIEKRGSSAWHGGVSFEYTSSALNANDQCAVSSTCGLRIDPTTSANTKTRLDGTAQYYNAQQDHYRYVTPSFQAGGPLFQDKLWMFVSYSPEFDRTRRDVISSFAGGGGVPGNAGLHTYYNSNDIQYGLARLDYRPLSKLSLFASWVNSSSRAIGALPNPDSKTGQLNSSAGTNPASFRSDTGFVAPGSVYSFGADYMVSSRTLASVRYGYLFYNTETRGTASGLRYLYNGSATGTTATLSGNAIPAAYQQSNGFQNISANLPTSFNAYTRKQFSADISIVHSGWYGVHNFKGGYQLSQLGNNTKTLYDYALVNVFYGQTYSVQNSTAGCDSIIAANQATWGVNAATKNCTGNYGYVTIQDGVDVIGKVSSTEHALYIQDAWSVGHSGLTINAGVRFDKEFLPAYRPGLPTIGFGFGDKIAPRIGGAYDVLHNGKLKVYASYGKFFDIMKYSLPQGSFGGNYWHNCTYTLDDPNYNLVNPTAPPASDGYRHSCPSSGLAPGVPSNAVTNTQPNTTKGDSFGRFIENVDLRATNNSAADPGVDPNIKPMSQHEFVAGADWAIAPTLSFSTRYARKRLDNTIEDMTLNDNYGYYIGNPGTAFGDFLHRAVPNIATATGNSAFLNPQGICPTCPFQPKASRRYDGIEFRVDKRGHNYFVNASYTYSRLYGNYPGLTSTNIADGTGGRHNPNNNRSFDLPQMQFTAYGKPFDGPLPTDRPHTVQAYGSYRVKTRLGETNLGLSQSVFSGSPISTCVPTTSTSSACQFVEDQGNFVPFTRDSVGNLIAGNVVHNYRTPVFTQTGANLTHYIHVSKQHESQMFGGEINAINLLNQHAPMSYNDLPITSSATIATTSNPTGVDYHALETGFNYVTMMNGTTAASTAPKTLSNQYGLPNVFQSARQIRVKLSFVF